MEPSARSTYTPSTISPLHIMDWTSDEAILQDSVCGERRWTWHAIFEDWKSYTPGQHRRLDLAVAEMKTRLPIPKLILCTLRITSGVSVLISQDAFHPPLCRAGTPAHDAAVARYGYPSLATFSQDLQDFLDANEWALRMIITLQRQLQRDANPDVPFSQLPMLLRFSLRVQAIWSSSTHKHRSPATRFGVVSQTFHDLDAYARNETRMWEQTAVLRDEAHRAFIHKYSQYIGQLFVVQYEVPGTNHFQFEFYPLQTPLAPTPGTVEQRRLILEDMMGFCTRSINEGFPLRTNTSEEVMFPVNLEACPGTFVRSGGCWTWKAILDDWKSYTPGRHRRLDLAVAAVKMRMPIQLLILTSLWITCCVSVVVPQDIFDEERSAVFLDVLLPIQAYIDLRDSVNLQGLLTGIQYDQMSMTRP